MIGEPVRLATNWSIGARLLRFALFVSAATAAAGAMGAALGALGHLALPRHTLGIRLIALIFGIVVLARELGLVARLPLPQRRWQIPRSWLGNFWTSAVIFGSIMGAGVFTYQPSALFFLYIVACILSGSASTGALFGALFGLSFSLAVAAVTFRWRAEPAEVRGARALRLLRRVRTIGAIVAPLVATLPFT